MAILGTTLLGSPALAQPISFDLKADVAAGQKPVITITAMDRVLDLQLDLARDDQEKFHAAHPGLQPGEVVRLPIGDGHPGRAHYDGTIALKVAGADPWSYPLHFDTVIRAPVTINYDNEHLDLAGRALRFQLSRPAGKAEVTVIGDDGNEIGHGAAAYHKEPAGTWLPIQWEQGAGNVMMLRLKAIAADGLVGNMDLTPWAVAIDHEDVNFKTDSAVIEPGEAGKLDASLRRIEEVTRRAERFIKVRLYVAGHTDTVGSRDHNRKLSLDRARAIAEYFRQKGLKIPISYEGFGEDAPKVKTPDETDEPKNRRADYVLGAVGAPAPSSLTAHHAVRGDWKAIK
jgi:outer membrane protein OmpA-like peptidoglycan-associated protein